MKNSLKMRFSVAFSCIAVSVIIICSLSAYTYEILISRLADYSLSLSELNEFRFQFGELNNVIDEYLESGSVESREKYGDIRTEVTDLCEKINQEYSSGDDDIQSSLAVSVYSTFSKYIQQTDEIINSVDRDKARKLFNNKYSKNSGYIDNYTEKLISSRYKTSEETLEETNDKIIIFKAVLVFVLAGFSMLIIGLAIMVFKDVIAPIEKLSRQSKQIANFNFDINIDIPKNSNEISVLSENFNNMKNSLKEFFETNEKNIQVLDELLIHFEGNEEFKNYIDNHREVNDAIFRQANIDHVSGTMNYKAFMHCVRDDISIMDSEKTCAVAAVEIVNFSEISNIVLDGADELLKSTVKHLNYVLEKSGYVARVSKGMFLLFIPDTNMSEDIDKICADIINAIDGEFVYHKVKQHVLARVNALVSHSPKSEKMMVNFVINGLENIEPGKYGISEGYF
ncbi:MAG: diguanylate cyclase [Oscillospiraceae bacterium]|nr:diguanylate cyclase [Oscillospiraceae bacterium]